MVKISEFPLYYFLFRDLNKCLKYTFVVCFLNFSGSSPATAALGGNAVNSIGGGSGETSSAITPEMVNEAMQRAMATVAPNSRLGTNSEVSVVERDYFIFTILETLLFLSKKLLDMPFFC